MSSYHVWILSAARTKVCLLESWLSLTYSQRLNGIGTFNIVLPANDDKIADADITTSAGVQRIRRIRIVRDGVVVFGGFAERVVWSVGDRETWTLHGGDDGLYLQWRIILPGVGDDTYAVTDSADDVCKKLVRYHAGSSAAAARQFSDLSVQADSGSAPSYSAEERYTILLNALTSIAERDKVYWRMKPGLTGCTFETGYPLYGLDRTKGNGANDECVFTVDRRNWLKLAYVNDRTGHANFCYVGGQGEGSDRTIIERSDATAITNCYRRERFVDARQLSLTASLQARGDAALQEQAAQEDMDVQPIATTWKATTGTTWDLGDQVTVNITPEWPNARTVAMSAVVSGIDVTVDQSGSETVTPLLEKV